MTTNTSSLTFQRIFGSSTIDENVASWNRVFEKCAKPVCLYYIPPLLACYFVTHILLSKTTDWKDLKLQRLAGQVSMYPAFFVLIITSHVATMDQQFWTGHEARFQASDWWCDTFANFYIAVNIVQALGQIQTEKPPLLYQLMAHHVLSIFCYSCGFYFDRFRWWTTLAGCCELTNLFLVPVFMSKDYFPEWRKEYWFLISSKFLWWTFVSHRMILFPCWLGLWAKDRVENATSEDHYVRIHWIEGSIYPLTILGLFLLSIVWLIQIDRGLKKQQKIYNEAQQEKKKL